MWASTKKISGPILDRIDLQVELDRLSTDERFEEATEEDTLANASRTGRGRSHRQVKRFEGTEIPHNAAIPGGQVRPYCNFSDDGFALYKEVIDTHEMTTRSIDRLAEVAEDARRLVGNGAG